METTVPKMKNELKLASNCQIASAKKKKLAPVGLYL
jgi:hypothetical protein